MNDAFVTGWERLTQTFGCLRIGASPVCLNSTSTAVEESCDQCVVCTIHESLKPYPCWRRMGLVSMVAVLQRCSTCSTIMVRTELIMPCCMLTLTNCVFAGCLPYMRTTRPAKGWYLKDPVTGHGHGTTRAWPSALHIASVTGALVGAVCPYSLGTPSSTRHIASNIDHRHQTAKADFAS